MAVREGDLADDTIVMLGKFNAGILQPAWLEAQGLVATHDLKLEEQLIAPPITMLKFGWMAMQVTEDRAVFVTSAEAPTPGPLADFVVDLFRILEHTPVYALGMNHVLHFVLADGAWDRIAERIAPPAAVEDALPDASLTTVQWGMPRRDGLAGRVNVTVQPSERLSKGGFIEWNSHVDLAEPADAAGAMPAVEVLRERWDEDRRDALETFDRVRELA
jgi:hypothetical protein